jgi:hypothetical protein
MLVLVMKEISSAASCMRSVLLLHIPQMQKSCPSHLRLAIHCPVTMSFLSSGPILSSASVVIELVCHFLDWNSVSCKGICESRCDTFVQAAQLSERASKQATSVQSLLTHGKEVVVAVEQHGGGRPDSEGGVNGLDYALLATAQLLRL